jgi:threonine synthase
VKQLFADETLKAELDAAGFCFSSANSINIGRLVPQVVYYVYAYGRLLASGKIRAGEPMNVVVPTGNFGNILAAFYAKNMGLPVGKLICASNENKVLFDFFESGRYDRNREFHLTSSPSMDILISSNLERLIYRLAGDDAEKNAAFMTSLAKTGAYEITDEMKAALSDFHGGYATEAETAEEIRRVYEKEGYVIDTHTAVASHVSRVYREQTGDQAVTVIASTASPYKFARSVMQAIDPKYTDCGDFELIDELSVLSHTEIPAAIEEIRTAPVLHDHVIEICEMRDSVKQFLGICR